MPIFVIGINHKTAPVTLREKLYFPLEKLPLYIQDLIGRGHAREAVILSTCNRSELYCEADDVESIGKWFSEQTTALPSELDAAIYIYRDEDAVAHIMSVACGLDSMVFGEPQILGQLKEAFSESCSAGGVNVLFNRLFQQIFSVVKEIRTTTAIGACPVSVASSAVHFAKQHCNDFENAKVALIGAGDTTALLMRYLGTQVLPTLTIVNRSLEKAEALAQGYHAQAMSITKLEEVLQQSDVVFSATGSATPIIQQDLMAKVMKKRGSKPLLLIDVAVPRDIDPAVAVIPGVSLYCIDDLKMKIEENRHGREHAAIKANELIREKSIQFIAELKSLDIVSHAICAYRGQIEELCRAELLKAQQQLHQGEDPANVLHFFARAFTQKLLHAPSVQLRQAGAEGRFELLKFARQLFSIPDPEVEHS